MLKELIILLKIQLKDKIFSVIIVFILFINCIVFIFLFNITIKKNCFIFLYKNPNFLDNKIYLENQK